MTGHKSGMNFGLQMFPLNITEPFLTQDSEGCVLGFTDILGFKFRLFVFLYFLSLYFHNFYFKFSGILISCSFIVCVECVYEPALCGKPTCTKKLFVVCLVKRFHSDSKFSMGTLKSNCV